ncbi:MAG: hypothetical protein DHS20C15_27190 [Planctomycetota bacterium]|nr:MAG: hypothetical protein DHS20C15_27190 [Planctomycetota bacterium]
MSRDTLHSLLMSCSALALTLALAPVALSQQEGFCAQDGLIVIEVENAPPAGSWVAETSLGGFTGDSYYRWSGPDLFTSPGSGVLTYTINITDPGDYQMRYRNFHDDPDHTMENDAWTRMDGGSWVKTYSGPGEIWTFHTRHEYSHDNKQPAHYNLSAGYHTFQISGRSHDFRIDRIHFFKTNGPTHENASLPESPFGDCLGELPHPAKKLNSFTGVFSDGTLGGLEVKAGDISPEANNPGEVGRHLQFDGVARALLPGRTYTDQEVLVRLRPRMPEGSWFGVLLRADSPNDDFSAGGPQSMVRLHRSPGSGEVRVHLHDSNGVIYNGPSLPLSQVDPDTQPLVLRVVTDGSTVNATVNGVEAMQGGFSGIADPASGGYTSLRSLISAGTAGTIGVDYVLVRAEGDIPDVHFDNDGKLWLSMLEDDNTVPGVVDPGSFSFQHQTLNFGLAGFIGFILPLFDYVATDADHFLLGVVDSGLNFAPGSETVLHYKGDSEGDFAP